MNDAWSESRKHTSGATSQGAPACLWWADGSNIVAIPLAAGVLASRGILLPLPAFAAVLMSASAVIVAINAQLLRRAQL
jgi:P-type Cu2+ transporter